MVSETDSNCGRTTKRSHVVTTEARNHMITDGLALSTVLRSAHAAHICIAKTCRMLLDRTGLTSNPHLLVKVLLGKLERKVPFL